MKNKKICFNCGKPVVKDVIALHRKLFSYNVDRFFCLPCLAEYLECSEDELKKINKRIKRAGMCVF